MSRADRQAAGILDQEGFTELHKVGRPRQESCVGETSNRHRRRRNRWLDGRARPAGARIEASRSLSRLSSCARLARGFPSFRTLRFSSTNRPCGSYRENRLADNRAREPDIAGELIEHIAGPSTGIQSYNVHRAEFLKLLADAQPEGTLHFSPLVWGPRNRWSRAT